MKYHFDDVYGQVYEFDNGVFIYLGSYDNFGLHTEMSETEKTITVEEELIICI